MKSHKSFWKHINPSDLAKSDLAVFYAKRFRYNFFTNGAP